MTEFAYYKRYPRDILSDCRHLSPAAYGSYNFILDTMWLQGGRLPFINKELARIAGLGSTRHWVSLWDQLQRFFTLSEDASGQQWISQKRLSQELQEAREHRGGQAGKANKRWGNVIDIQRSDPGEKSGSERNLSPASLARKSLKNNKPTYAAACPPARATPQTIESLNKNPRESVAARATDAPRPDPSEEERNRVGKKYQSLNAILERALPDIAAKAERPAELPAGYSEREVAALAKAFPHVEDMSRRLAGLLEWCAKQGITRENEAKKAIFTALRKEAGNIKLEAERQAQAAA